MSFLKGNVKVPLVGELPKWSVYGGGTLMLGFAGVWYYRRRQASSAASTTASSTDATATDTGSGYGDGGYGYGGDTSLGSDPYGLYDPNTGQYLYPGTGAPGPTVPVITTDAEWTQQVVTILQSSGYDPQSVTSAIGLAFAGHCLTADQETLWSAAVAVGGTPPAPGTPVPVHLCGKGTGGGGGGASKPKRAPGGLHVTGLTATSATLNWSKVAGATAYDVSFTEAGPGNAGQSERHITVTDNSYHMGALNPHTTHHWQVAARNSVGAGPKSRSESFTTKTGPGERMHPGS
jgi:Fibronectin type III domain